MTNFETIQRFKYSFQGIDYKIFISDPDPEIPNERRLINQDVKKCTIIFRANDAKNWVYHTFVTYKLIEEPEWKEHICSMAFHNYKKKNP